MVPSTLFPHSCTVFSSLCSEFSPLAAKFKSANLGQGYVFLLRLLPSPSPLTRVSALLLYLKRLYPTSSLRRRFLRLFSRPDFRTGNRQPSSLKPPRTLCLAQERTCTHNRLAVWPGKTSPILTYAQGGCGRCSPPPVRSTRGTHALGQRAEPIVCTCGALVALYTHPLSLNCRYSPLVGRELNPLTQFQVTAGASEGIQSLPLLIDVSHTMFRNCHFCLCCGRSR